MAGLALHVCFWIQRFPWSILLKEQRTSFILDNLQCKGNSVLARFYSRILPGTASNAHCPRVTRSPTDLCHQSVLTTAP